MSTFGYQLTKFKVTFLDIDPQKQPILDRHLNYDRLSYKDFLSEALSIDLEGWIQKSCWRRLIGSQRLLIDPCFCLPKFFLLTPQNLNCFNNRFLRERGMVSNPKMEYHVFLNFPKELSYGYLRFEGNGKIPSNLR